MSSQMKPPSRDSEGRPRGPWADTAKRGRSLGFRLVSDQPPGALRPTGASASRGTAESEATSRPHGQAAEVGGVYIISVAARILEMHPQTLRKYERIGLVTPFRTDGMLRLYSDEDIIRLRLIKHLVGHLGLNLAGVHLALGLFNQMLALRGHVDSLEGKALKNYLNECLDDIFELLHARFP